MQQPYQGQIQVQTVPPASASGGNQTSKYSGKLQILGILQIVLCVVSVVTGAAECLVWKQCTYAASAIWGGILFYLPAGILAVLTAKIASARTELAIAGMVMSILAAVIAVISFGLYTAAFGLNLEFLGYVGPAVADAITSLVSLAELVIAIATAVHCGLVLKEPRTSMVTYEQQVQPNTYSPQLQNIGATGSYMANPAPPMYTHNKEDPILYAGEEKSTLP